MASKALMVVDFSPLILSFLGAGAASPKERLFRVPNCALWDFRRSFGGPSSACFACPNTALTTSIAITCAALAEQVSFRWLPLRRGFPALPSSRDVFVSLMPLTDSPRLSGYQSVSERLASTNWPNEYASSSPSLYRANHFARPSGFVHRCRRLVECASRPAHLATQPPNPVPLAAARLLRPAPSRRQKRPASMKGNPHRRGRVKDFWLNSFRTSGQLLPLSRCVPIEASEIV